MSLGRAFSTCLMKSSGCSLSTARDRLHVFGKTTISRTRPGRHAARSSGPSIVSKAQEPSFRGFGRKDFGKLEVTKGRTTTSQTMYYLTNLIQREVPSPKLGPDPTRTSPPCSRLSAALPSLQVQPPRRRHPAAIGGRWRGAAAPATPVSPARLRAAPPRRGGPSAGPGAERRGRGRGRGRGGGRAAV
jgi:hypothetical protein